MHCIKTLGSEPKAVQPEVLAKAVGEEEEEPPSEDIGSEDEAASACPDTDLESLAQKHKSVSEAGHRAIIHVQLRCKFRFQVFFARWL